MSRPPLFDASGLASLRRAVLTALEPPQLGLAVAGAPAAAPWCAPGRPTPERSSSFALSIAAGAAAASERVYAPGPAAVPAPTAHPAGRDDPDTRRMTQLVDLAKEGDTEAFALLYDRYIDTIYRYVYYRVGSRQLAEDLTSETFLRALRRIGTFTWQGRDFGAWLVTIARNLVADHFKSSRFRLEVTTGEMIDSDGVEESPEGAVMEAFTNSALLAAVKRLNPQQQECLVLRFLQGLSVAETARIMGKNEGAIKTLQYRAVRALAQLLPEDVR
jgi:RNA polymerase sigma-70 factor (ECF subfamily)